MAVYFLIFLLHATKAQAMAAHAGAGSSTPRQVPTSQAPEKQVGLRTAVTQTTQLPAQIEQTLQPPTKPCTDINGVHTLNINRTDLRLGSYQSLMKSLNESRETYSNAGLDLDKCNAILKYLNLNTTSEIQSCKTAIYHHWIKIVKILEKCTTLTGETTSFVRDYDFKPEMSLERTILPESISKYHRVENTFIPIPVFETNANFSYYSAKEWITHGIAPVVITNKPASQLRQEINAHPYHSSYIDGCGNLAAHDIAHLDKLFGLNLAKIQRVGSKEGFLKCLTSIEKHLAPKNEADSFDLWHRRALFYALHEANLTEITGPPTELLADFSLELALKSLKSKKNKEGSQQVIWDFDTFYGTPEQTSLICSEIKSFYVKTHYYPWDFEYSKKEEAEQLLQKITDNQSQVKINFRFFDLLKDHCLARLGQENFTSLERSTVHTHLLMAFDKMNEAHFGEVFFNSETAMKNALQEISNAITKIDSDEPDHSKCRKYFKSEWQ
jgi:hypothetical protein